MSTAAAGVLNINITAPAGLVRGNGPAGWAQPSPRDKRKVSTRALPALVTPSPPASKVRSRTISLEVTQDQIEENLKGLKPFKKSKVKVDLEKGLFLLIKKYYDDEDEPQISKTNVFQDGPAPLHVTDNLVRKAIYNIKDHKDKQEFVKRMLYSYYKSCVARKAGGMEHRICIPGSGPVKQGEEAVEDWGPTVVIFGRCGCGKSSMHTFDSAKWGDSKEGGMLDIDKIESQFKSAGTMSACTRHVHVKKAALFGDKTGPHAIRYVAVDTPGLDDPKKKDDGKDDQPKVDTDSEILAGIREAMQKRVQTVDAFVVCTETTRLQNSTQTALESYRKMFDKSNDSAKMRQAMKAKGVDYKDDGRKAKFVDHTIIIRTKIDFAMTKRQSRMKDLTTTEVQAGQWSKEKRAESSSCLKKDGIFTLADSDEIRFSVAEARPNMKENFEVSEALYALYCKFKFAFTRQHAYDVRDANEVISKIAALHRAKKFASDIGEAKKAESLVQGAKTAYETAMKAAKDSADTVKTSKKALEKQTKAAQDAWRSVSNAKSKYEALEKVYGKKNLARRQKQKEEQEWRHNERKASCLGETYTRSEHWGRMDGIAFVTGLTFFIHDRRDDLKKAIFNKDREFERAVGRARGEEDDARKECCTAHDHYESTRKMYQNGPAATKYAREQELTQAKTALDKSVDNVLAKANEFNACVIAYNARCKKLLADEYAQVPGFGQTNGLYAGKYDSANTQARQNYIQFRSDNKDGGKKPGNSRVALWTPGSTDGDDSKCDCNPTAV